MWNFSPFFNFRLLNFIWVKTIHTRYLKAPPGSGLYNGKKIMVMQHTNPFLFMKILIPPKWIWKSLLYLRKTSGLLPFSACKISGDFQRPSRIPDFVFHIQSMWTTCIYKYADTENSICTFKKTFWKCEHARHVSKKI